MLTESVFVPGSVEIATPAPGIDVKEIKMDALITEMETAYPNAAELYRSLMGLADPETGLIPRGYPNEKTGTLDGVPVFATRGGRNLALARYRIIQRPFTAENCGFRK